MRALLPHVWYMRAGTVKRCGGCVDAQVTRTERIRAKQSLAAMRSELRDLARAKREEKGLPARRVEVIDDDDVEVEEDEAEGEDGLSPWTPEERTRMYREMAEQKEEQEKSKSHLNPKKR